MASHLTVLRVRYGETDKAGVAWHGSYVAWYEAARCEMLRDGGLSYADFERDTGLFLTVVGMELRFLRPARSDEVLVIRTAVESVERASAWFIQQIHHQGGAALTASARVRVACVDGAGRVAALPSALREVLMNSLGKTPPATGVVGALP